MNASLDAIDEMRRLLVEIAKLVIKATALLERASERAITVSADPQP